LKVEPGLTALLKQLGSASHSATETKASAAGHSSGQEQSRPATATDSIELGQTARLLSAAEAIISATSIDDHATTEAFANAIADGSYHVNYQDVASHLFDFELSLERGF